MIFLQLSVINLHSSYSPDPGSNQSHHSPPPPKAHCLPPAPTLLPLTLQVWVWVQAHSNRGTEHMLTGPRSAKKCDIGSGSSGPGSDPRARARAAATTAAGPGSSQSQHVLFAPGLSGSHNSEEVVVWGEGEDRGRWVQAGSSGEASGKGQVAS